MAEESGGDPALKVAPQDLRLATMAELFEEIKARSVGVLLISYNVQGIQPTVETLVYGDRVTIKSMCEVLTEDVTKHLKPKEEKPK